MTCKSTRRLAEAEERLVALLDQAIELLRIEQTMRERASRNGKITHADHGSGSDSDSHD